MARVSGTEGYADEARDLVLRYESLRSVDTHRAVRHLFPSPPGTVLDIGAGTGRDAAWFAAMGYSVVAVEPTNELRLPAIALHPHPAIEWLDDSLPDLAVLRQRRQTFDLVMLTAVWMHLDEAQRRAAMPNLDALLRDGGVIAITLRHGPVPTGRRMFEVSADETVALAQRQGLSCVVNRRTESSLANNRVAGVSWTSLAFVKPPRD